MPDVFARSALLGFAGALLVGCAGAPVGMPGDPAYRLVEVVGSGDSASSAEKAAINAAIGEASGQLILGEQRVENDRLTRDRIDSYSAGYIRDHEVLETWRSNDGRYRARVRARVASSSIHHRALPVSGGGGRLPGRQVSTEIQTQFEQRESGDRMLAAVLDGYPEQAYTVTLGVTRTVFDSARSASLMVRYSIQMSSVYLSALGEVAGVIASETKSCNAVTRTLLGGLRRHPNNPGPGSGGLLVSPNVSRMAEDACGDNSDLMIHTVGLGSVFTGSKGFSFFDDGPLTALNSKLWGPHHVLAQFFDETDALVGSSCIKMNPGDLFRTRGSDPRRVYDLSERSRRNRPELSPVASVVGEFNIKVGKDGLPSLSRVSRMSARIVGNC